MKPLIYVFFFFFGQTLWAASFFEDFTTRNNLSTTIAPTAVWNQSLSIAHPPLQVIGAFVGSPKSFEVGDGRHGSFDSSTYASFSINGDVSGNIIRLDTSLYPTLQVTNFSLDADWTLEPVGENPLVIYSLKNVIIVGEIHCQGQDGANGVNGIPGIGGSGRCGGKDGGNGASPGTSDGTNGADALGGVVEGGKAGNYTGGAGVGGGGGGSWNSFSLPNDGANVNAGGGQAGIGVNEGHFANLAGGSGGGGGGSTATDAGAGGGAGGGVVIIHTVHRFELGTSTNTASGFIFANGGDGGTSNVAGGAGGGGAGGSVMVFAGGSIDFFNASFPSSDARFGGGGANGGTGRSWFSTIVGTYNAVGTGGYDPGENPPHVPGDSKYLTTPQQIESQSFDTGSTLPQINSITMSPASNEFLGEFAGSDDNFVRDDTGWTTNVDDLLHKRYLKFRVTITGASADARTELDSVTIEYASGELKNFEFETAGCGILKNNESSEWPTFLLLFPLFFAVWIRFYSLKLKAQ